MREIGDRKFAYVDETRHFGEIEESSLRLILFYDLEPSDMNVVDIDACKVPKVWVE